MTAPPFHATPLVARHLRALTIAPRAHPRGQPHLSAASGLVCAHGRAYVIGDDEHHLATFRDTAAPGDLHTLLPGRLPHGKAARKRRKPDMETLLHLPAWRSSAGGALVALGSGSRPNRSVGVVIPLNADGEPSTEVHRFDLNPLHEPLRAALGEINIEGAVVAGDELLLLHRGTNETDSAVARCRLSDLLRCMAGDTSPAHLRSVDTYELGTLNGVRLGFTDGAALPDGGWVFSAVAEDTASSFADGRCSGSVIGVVDAGGNVLALHRVEPPVKIEGIAVQVHAGGATLCLVTDADDPGISSCMLMARLDVLPRFR